MPGQYTFGDTDLAARRLALVAEVFEPPSRDLLSSPRLAGLDTILDLGCGPGFTTRLLAEVCRPRRVIGLDRSGRFLEVARRLTDDPRITDAAHDVTAVPLPVAPAADAVYGRLLLAHLPDPLGLVERWRAQVRPGGVVVLDEIETMEPPPGVLTEYEELVVALVAAEGGAMYAGPLLEGLGGTCVEWPVDAALAARMYSMNLATWRTGAEERGLATAPQLDALAAALDALAAGSAAAPPVRWVLRQVVVDVNASSST